ncbi:hypothetical protein [Streptomyces sp. NPDC006307]|uniref:hypothetical protein n=1 Tax=Streptomyces sp. NPDC006307 TaxID=3156748 RepID=UPI0033BBB59E
MDEESRAAEAAAVRNEMSGGMASAIVQSGSIGTVHVGGAPPPDPFLWLPVRETDPVALGGALRRHVRPPGPRRRTDGAERAGRRHR